MKTQPSHPQQGSGKERPVSSQDKSTRPADPRREEVSKQLGLAMNAIARLPSPGDQRPERRHTELVDAAQEELLQIQDIMAATRAHARAHAAAEAASRIANGTYGICQACGQPIPPPRLQAVPLTPFCFPCQEAREQGRRDRYRLDDGMSRTRETGMNRTGD